MVHGTRAHTRGHEAHSQAWWSHSGPGTLGGYREGGLQWNLFLSRAGGQGCPEVRKGRRKPLLCVLFLVGKMKWLLGAESTLRPASLLLKGASFPSPPSPASSGTCVWECNTQGQGDTLRSASDTQDEHLGPHREPCPSLRKAASVRDGTLRDKDFQRQLRCLWPVLD